LSFDLGAQLSFVNVSYDFLLFIECVQSVRLVDFSFTPFLEESYLILVLKSKDSDLFGAFLLAFATQAVVRKNSIDEGAPLFHV
jgi:hypothetical protein